VLTECSAGEVVQLPAQAAAFGGIAAVLWHTAGARRRHSP
jgi:hypothetical protein